MQVPFYDMRPANESCRSEIESATARVLERSWYILGEELEQFEAEFAAYCGVSHCIGVNSGTDALWLALLAAGIGPGDEVVSVSHTFVATAIAIRKTGAIPVFADVDPQTLQMDVDCAAALIGPRTRAILPVHIYGRLCSPGPLRALAERHGLALIEDACQAHGAQIEGFRSGALGTAGCFSFYPTKNLGALGDGGAVVTEDQELAGKLRRLRNYGETEKYHHGEIGFNSRLDEMQAAVLRAKLPLLEHWNSERSRLADGYRRRLDGFECLQLPADAAQRSHVWHLFVVQLPEHANREDIQNQLTRDGVASACHYPVPVHRQKAFGDLQVPDDALPVTSQAASRILSLPLFPGMDIDCVEHVAQALQSALKL